MFLELTNRFLTLWSDPVRHAVGDDDCHVIRNPPVSADRTDPLERFWPHVQIVWMLNFTRNTNVTHSVRVIDAGFSSRLDGASVHVVLCCAIW